MTEHFKMFIPDRYPNIAVAAAAAAAAAKSLQSCLTLYDPIDSSPPGTPPPQDSSGKNTGVGCYFLLQCKKVKSESEVAQSCPTLSDPMDCSPPGSSVHGIFQARVLEWGTTAFSVYQVRSPIRTNSKVLTGPVKESVFSTNTSQSSPDWPRTSQTDLTLPQTPSLAIAPANTSV